MESWRKVWREGLAPVLSTVGLEALAQGLAADDPRLIQGATTLPLPVAGVEDWPVEATCVVGYCAWQGEGLQTVGEIEEHFAQVCGAADAALGEPGACRWFLNWYDEAPREEMRRLLLEEVELALAQRRQEHLPVEQDRLLAAAAA